MMEMLIKEIISLEWMFFDKVQNCGGRAPCQDDRETFEIMRGSQLEAWSIPLCESWLADLKAAEQEGHNPMSEKYGYMMARTSPEEYDRIAHLLPARSAEKDHLIDFICRAHVLWQEKITEKYPHLAGRGRPIHKELDSPYVTSFETYLWGELAVYSTRTLQIYADYVRELLYTGRNMSEMVLKNTVRNYGYETLETAEAAC